MERWKLVMKHPPCAFEVSESQRDFSRRSIPIWQLKTKYVNSRALRISRGLARCAVPGDSQVPFIGALGIRGLSCSAENGSRCRWLKGHQFPEPWNLAVFSALIWWRCNASCSLRAKRQRSLCWSTDGCQWGDGGFPASLAALLTNLTKWDVLTYSLRFRKSSRCWCSFLAFKSSVLCLVL